MRKRTALLAVLAMVAATFAASAPLSAQTDSQDPTRERSGRLSGNVAESFERMDPNEIVHVFIQLDEPSVAEFNAIRDGAPPALQRAQGEAVVDQQNRARSLLADLIVEERSNLVVAANGLRVMVRAGDVPAIREVEGVESVARVARHHLLNETSIPAIGADTVQDADVTGEDVRIAIIDTGIDYTHATFGGSGDPLDYDENDTGVVEPGTFPTDKVVNGFDFAGPIYDASSQDPNMNTPQPDPDPIDVFGHGTHVAGTAAGEGTASVGAGVAPEADLLALKVFGDVTGSTALVSDAIEFALDPNNDLDMADHVDVINMSLGSNYGHPDDPSAIASQNAAENGIVVVAASGNAGPLPYVTSSPALAPDAISVAASIDAGVTVLGMTVNSPGTIADQYEAQPGNFGDLNPDTTGDLAIADPLDACDPSDPAGLTGLINNPEDLDGNIAYIKRGTCSFSAKIRAAEEAGAIGALVFNNVEGPPIAMGEDGSIPQPDIPAMMISLADGETILAVAEAETVNVTLTDDVQIPKPDLADTMAGFSSRGPGLGNTFKPEISAPGFLIFSAEVGSGDDGNLSSGTSMATPHVAGVAALLVDQYPGLEVGAIKSLIMNSARFALTNPAGGTVDIARQGNGVVQADRAALDVEGYTTPAGVSFGRINPTEAYADSRTVDMARLDGEGDATYDVEVVENQTLDGVTFDVSDSTVTTSSGDGSFDVSIEVDPTALAADDEFLSQTEADGWVRLTNQSNPDDTMVVGLQAVVDPAATLSAAGGAQVVTVANDGPSSGFAEGFTRLAAGDQVAGNLATVGFRTADAEDPETGPYRQILFGVALDDAWGSPSSLEIDILIDTDEDGDNEYALVAADVGLLQGAAEPTGQMATALFDLAPNGSAVLLYLAVADFNDQVAILPADLTGPFGFLPEDASQFHITVNVFDQLGMSGSSNEVKLDLEGEITGDEGLTALVAAGGSDEVGVEGKGDMLWLFANNPVGEQFDVAEVTTPQPPDEPPGPPDEIPEFEDVPADHLFHSEIVWLAQEGITRGCNPPANDRFCPDDEVSREQMAAFLNRALDLAATDDDFFVDDEGNIFEGDINELAASGITKGCNPPTNDEFCPDRLLTRAEMASFMARGFGFSDGAGDDLFVDDDASVHETAIDIIGTAGVTRGCNPPTNDEYCPERLITRGEMAAFIFRAYQAAGLDG